MRAKVAGLLEIVGAASVVYGLSMLAVWVAWVAGGLMLLAAAVHVESNQ